MLFVANIPLDKNNRAIENGDLIEIKIEREFECGTAFFDIVRAAWYVDFLEPCLGKILLTAFDSAAVQVVDD